MITAILVMAFTWCLFFGRISQPFHIILCVGLGVFFACFSKQKHPHALSTDVMAQKSKLKDINPTLKFWTVLTLMLTCTASNNALTGVFLVITFLAVLVVKKSLYRYVPILAMPVSFLLIGGIALLFETSAEPMGVLHYNIFGLWFCVTTKAQIHTALILSRAFGALSCLCFLSITTPITDTINVLRRARCPELMIDLMYLIYRYIFILLWLHNEMRNAAKSRLGFWGYQTSLRTTGKIYANLLARSYLFAGKNFDAMESRCYNTGIKFLERPNQVKLTQVCISIALVMVSLFFNFYHIMR